MGNEPADGLPMFEEGVSAGFPTPAGDGIDRRLDLNALMAAHPDSTFYVRVDGDSMIEGGIFSGDILAVDRSLDPHEGDIVVASVDGEFCVKVLRFQKGQQPVLYPQNRNYPAIRITENMEFSLFGVVTGVIRKLK